MMAKVEEVGDLPSRAAQDLHWIADNQEEKSVAVVSRDHMSLIHWHNQRSEKPHKDRCGGVLTLG